MKVAIIHYWFLTRRGGEKVVESILKIFPDADIYTLFYDNNQYGKFLDNHKIYTSWLNKPFLRKHYQKIFPLYPIGIKSLKLKKDYDLIISSESGPAKGIEIKNNAPHVCYIHSPMRYCWSHVDLYINAVHPFLRPLTKYFLKQLRNWDKKTVSNVDLFISNSYNVNNRVRKYYNRESKVIYPPISEKLFLKPLKKKTKKDTYLSFGALTPYKRIDLLIDTFNTNGKKLVIVGNGAEKEKLKSRSKSNIEFKEAIEWQEVEEIFCKTRALLFPGEEDFGMIPLEIMAYGIPVIALKKGGALETVIEDRNDYKRSTGLFFDEQNVNSLDDAIELFEKVENKFDPEWIRNHAFKFREKEFLSNFIMCIDSFIPKKIDDFK